MTVKELVVEMKTDKTLARGFNAEDITGGGALPAQPKKGSSPFTITEEAAKDPAVYRDAKAKAEKAGRPLGMS